MKQFLKLVFGVSFIVILAWLLVGFQLGGMTGLGSLAGSGLSQIAARALPLQSEPAIGTRQQGQNGDKLVLGDTYTLASGESLDGDLLVFGGSAILEEDSIVEKDVIVIGGTVNINGKVRGDVSAVAGMVSLGGSAMIEGDVNSMAGQLARDEGARIEGEVNTGTMGPFSLTAPGTLHIPGLEKLPPITLPRSAGQPAVNIGFNPLWDGLWWLIRSFLWAALAVVAVLLLEQRSERIAESVTKSPFVAGAMGCLTVFIFPFVLLVLVITICGIPFALIGVFVLCLAWGYGIIVVGYEIGKRLERLFKTDWAAPVSAGTGTFILTLGLNGIGALIPCVGWMAPAVVGLVGLGAVLLTRFGGRIYPYDEPGSDVSRIPDPLPLAPEASGAALSAPDASPEILPLPGEQADQTDR